MRSPNGSSQQRVYGRSSVAAKLILVLAAAPPILRGQESTARHERNHWGLSAGAAGAVSQVSFDGGDGSAKMATRVDVGYRFRHACINWLPVLCWQRVGVLRPLRVTAGVTLVVTDIRGMNVTRDEYAYSNVDPLGLRASYPVIGNARLFVETRQGKKTAERLANDRATVLNYYGKAVTNGVGVEIPLTRMGRGFEIGISRASGTFDTYELREVEYPANLRHKALMIHIGWSGPFSGVSLPWQ